MKIINYYQLSDRELDYKINEISKWFFTVKSDDPRWETAVFALGIAKSAKKLRDKPVDKFTQMAIDIFCK